jgi:endonuclease YncB( thermonuclease family)
MFAPLLFAAGLSGFSAGPHADVVGVAYVIDVDTIEIHGQRIRLHGIDAPRAARPASMQRAARGAAASGPRSRFRI